LKEISTAKTITYTWDSSS